jgi:nitroimidazol reductase NimA-like FMN-containing flavoprotein (pyridoxamine 5'-phosphate oxidase superfamily)
MTTSKVMPRVEILDLQQCWKRLGETSIGRLALIVEGRPDVFPVNYKVDQETLIFRTGNGTKFKALEADDHIALEADAVNAEFGTAWSVVVKGRAILSDSTTTTLDATGRALFPWQGVEKDHFVRIVPQTVSGRRYTLTTLMFWRSPLDDAIRAGLE